MPTTMIVRRAVLGCLVPLAMTAGACSSSDTTANALGDPVADEAGETSEVSWLASQTAEGGRIESPDGVPTRLVLDGIDAHTIMFSDRPDRLSDVVDTSAFIEQWGDLFADSAPNAVLVEHRPGGATDSLVVVLTDPVLDIDAGTLSYTIEVLADEDHPESISGLVGDVHDSAPTEFRAASLFIDSIHSLDEDEMSRTDDYIDQKDEDEGDPIDDGAVAVEDRADQMSE